MTAALVALHSSESPLVADALSVTTITARVRTDEGDPVPRVRLQFGFDSTTELERYHQGERLEPGGMYVSSSDGTESYYSPGMGCFENDDMFPYGCNQYASAMTDTDGLAEIVYRPPSTAQLGERESILIIVSLGQDAGYDDFGLEAIAEIHLIADE